MEKLLSSIATRIKYISNNTENKYISKMINIIDEKLNPIRDKSIKTEELLNKVVDNIENDIKLIKRVNGESNMVYKKMDELAGFIEQIKEEYFK